MRLTWRHPVEQFVLAAERVVGQLDEHVLVLAGHTEDLADDSGRNTRADRRSHVTDPTVEHFVEDAADLGPHPISQFVRGRPGEQRPDQLAQLAVLLLFGHHHHPAARLIRVVPVEADHHPVLGGQRRGRREDRGARPVREHRPEAGR
ncbi:hypothetical protein [Kibdelosporangium aridum]|uniref:hypothetical protein n=1 Tax=Kibdelosporangium aridum TaxID=2030 RepID=UPI0035EC395A